MTPQQRSLLRKQLRDARRQLSPRQQDEAAVRVHHHLSGERFFRAARRIAFYLANDGEIDPRFLLADAMSRGQHCYLPLLHARVDRLMFVRYREGDKLKSNRWGILEPQLRGGIALSPRALDLVFVPLVGFDARGNRLGMGKGFYDRTFAFKRLANRRRPLLIGLAHECQRVESIESEAWDVGLDGIVTDQQAWRSTPIF